MMPPKAADRIKAMRERAAALTPQSGTPAVEDAAAQDAEAAVAAVSMHFGSTLDALVANRAVQALPVGHIAPDTRPEMRQPRLLPPPDDLIEHGQPLPAYRDLVAELLTLGWSLKERQIQPIIVYPGTSDVYPAARYLILVGQRRWTAAMLTGIDALEVVVVDPPSAVDRVRVQYVENEAREEFSDMERAWALIQMKQVLGDAPWEAVETQFGISRSRRHELTRLLAFTVSQQRQIALLRLQETQIRSLHTGVRNQELTSAQVDAILFRLEQIAAERAAALATASMTEAGAGPPPRRVGIDGPTIARLVARAQRTAAPLAMVASTPTPRWLPPLRDQLMRTNQSVQRAARRVESLGSVDVDALLSDISHLVESLTGLAVNLGGGADRNDQNAGNVRQQDSSSDLA